MTNRLKTVQYAFPMTTSVITDATVTNLTQIQVYIPETITSFTSVTVDVGFQDIITISGGTIGEHRVGLRLGAAAYTTIVETDDIANSGENIAGTIGPWNFTPHFSTNWSGTTMTCDLQVYFDQTTGTTLGMRNTTAVITISYTYDDTATTHIKSVWIPLESLVGALPIVANSNFGTNQIPQLTGAGGMLPEADILVRDYYLTIEGNESNNNIATDYTVSANIDSGSATAFGMQEAGLGSDRFCRWIYKPAAIPITTAIHTFQLWATAARLNHVTVTLVVTYEFNHSTTTSVLNSIILPIELASPLGAATATEASRYKREFFIEEPGSIALRQSAFRINYNCNATPTGLRFRAGSQTYRAYTPLANSVCGMFSLQQRIDTSSAQGPGIALSRGINTITIDGYITVITNQATNVNGCLILNYTSDKAPNGAGSHIHTVFKNILQWDALLVDRTRIDGSVIIPEPEYRISSVGYLYYQMLSVTTNGVSIDVECMTNEGKGGGYYDIYTDVYQGDLERASSVIYLQGRDVMKRSPIDPDTSRIDATALRGYRIFNAIATSNGLMSMVSYHSVTFPVSGTISGSTGGLITINTFRSDTYELINTTTRTGDGLYSFTWYDDTIPIFSEAYEDSTHFGRSINATASTQLGVRLSNPVARAFA